MIEYSRQSLTQPAFEAKQVQLNEAVIAKAQGISLYQLMEMAGAAVFDQIQQIVTNNQVKSKRMLVLCGKGNNGGDGFIIARLAIEAGYQVEVFVLGIEQEIKGDAKQALEYLQATTTDIVFSSSPHIITEKVEIFKGELIVDSILGIGFSGSLTPEIQSMISAVNHHKAMKISVDVPTGLNAETGWVDSIAISADLTVTFIVIKKGLTTGQSANFVGQLVLADLTIGQTFCEKIESDTFIQNALTLPRIPTRKKCSHKGDIGLILTIGGNFGLPGAIRMASEAALRCGAALVAVTCCAENAAMVLSGRPELMLAPSDANELALFQGLGKAKVMLIGPGLGQDGWARAHFSLLTQPSVDHKTANKLEPEKFLVVDADALHLLSENPMNRTNWILTPHPGEAAKLLGCSVKEIEQNRFSSVKSIAVQYGGICVLKGAGSLISDGKQTWINTSGNSGMASGGMGDVLSGIIAALLLQMNNPFEAVRLAVYLHGLAADNIAKQKGSVGMLASDLFDELRQLVNRDLTV